MDYQAFIDDFDIEFYEPEIAEYYDRKQYTTTKYAKYPIKLTYKPNNKYLTFTFNSYVYNHKFKLTKDIIIDELKRNAKLVSVGEWKRNVDSTGVWYYNVSLRKGDVTKTDLALWNEHNNILKTLLDTSYDKFMMT